MTQATTTKTAAQQPPADVRTLDAATAKDIVFGTRVSRFVEGEPAEDIVQITAARIWDNLSAYFNSGDWPDRRRTAEEIDAEEAASC